MFSTKETILHVHTVPVISGSGINTLLTMKGSIARGHNVALATNSLGPLTEEAEAAGAEVIVIPTMTREVRPARDVLATARLAQLLHSKRFSIVHTHNSKAGFLGRLAARLTRPPLTVHTVHGFAFHDAEAPHRRATYRLLERTAAHWCDGLIFISPLLREWAYRENIARTRPSAVVYSGVDVTAFANADPSGFRKRFGIAESQIAVGIVSKLWDGKGHDILLRAWAKALMQAKARARAEAEAESSPPPRLLIIGEGPLENKLRGLARELGIAHTVTFTGFLQNTPEATAALDISVLPSLFEGMGRVIIEAQAAAKPVIATRVGGIPDLITHKKNGILVPPNDADALARELTQLLGDREARTELGRVAREQLRPEHSSQHMVCRIHEFYLELRSRDRSGRTAS